VIKPLISHTARAWLPVCLSVNVVPNKCSVLAFSLLRDKTTIIRGGSIAFELGAVGGTFVGVIFQLLDTPQVSVSVRLMLLPSNHHHVILNE